GSSRHCLINPHPRTFLLECLRDNRLATIRFQSKSVRQEKQEGKGRQMNEYFSVYLSPGEAEHILPGSTLPLSVIMNRFPFEVYKQESVTQTAGEAEARI